MPSLKNRSGLTLIELLVAMVLFGIVSLGIYRVLVNNQRVYQAQTQRIDLQQNIRAAVSILPAELRELDATDGDILAMGANTITVRTMRQLGFLCNTPVLGIGSPVLVIRNRPFFSVRDFNITNDSILVYYEGGQQSRNDDSWIPGRITAIAPGVCTDGTVGRTLTTALAFGTVAAPTGTLPATYVQLQQTGRIQIGAPVRGFEVVTYRAYQAADSKWYVGLQSGLSGGMQPLIGPILANGLTFTYRDSLGAVTAVPARVATIEVRLKAQTAQPLRQPNGTLGYPVDSVGTIVALRNNRRF
jgi:prepilin-type N-terminal cleavage/methylation domain-containing protein